MPSAHVDAVVRLKTDVPALQLCCGAEGIVVSVWLSHAGFLYEVEFPKSGEHPVRRTLLGPEQLEVVESRPPRLPTE